MAASAGILSGFLFGRRQPQHSCEVQLTCAQEELAGKLCEIVGKSNVSSNVTMRGSRLGKGTALAVVKPGSLKEAIAVLTACSAAEVAVLPQGANTSLTGGSVPRGECDRPTVIINMRRLNKILPIGADASQVLCFAGAGIFELQRELQTQYNRDSHSVLGSIFLNPSVAAGVSYGSGGTQIRKGPAFTNRALFCRVAKGGKVELIDTLGLKVQGDDVVSFLESATKLVPYDLDPKCKREASWPNYRQHLVKLDNSVSRYNADTSGVECNRSEGKVLILATLHDTYPMPRKDKVIWASCRDFETAQALKRQVCISSPDCMAKSCEYINREVHDAVDQAGRILIKMIEVLGMTRLEPLWNLKLFIESVPLPFATIICDKFLWWFNGILPKSLPPELQKLTQEYDHHMLMEFAEYTTGELETLMSRLKKFQDSQPAGAVCFHVCADGSERLRATLFRFAVAPAFRTYCIGLGQQGLSIDYALPKNFTQYPDLPPQYPIFKRLVYSHFGCNVYHEDFVFDNAIDVHEAKMAIKKAIERVGGKLPAEHGHGTEYAAPADMQQRWQLSDPTNTMNPGVGGTSYNKGYV
ncbi:dld [Symbiodinium pilosum]|uniref:Dld protein n=1 Tax=Symbiodinium pilosum TaxID=2952 RepID=A0A812SNE8_SYMPI|nr:dld [Symbiodinium pilosum]